MARPITTPTKPTRAISVHGALFEVTVESDGEDKPTRWVDCIRLGGVWWRAVDVLDEAFVKQLDAEVNR